MSSRGISALSTSKSVRSSFDSKSIRSGEKSSALWLLFTIFKASKLYITDGIVAPMNPSKKRSNLRICRITLRKRDRASPSSGISVRNAATCDCILLNNGSRFRSTCRNISSFGIPLVPIQMYLVESVRIIYVQSSAIFKCT